MHISRALSGLLLLISLPLQGASCPHTAVFQPLYDGGACLFTGLQLPAAPVNPYCSYAGSGYMGFYWEARQQKDEYQCPGGFSHSSSGQHEFCLVHFSQDRPGIRPHCTDLHSGQIGFAWSDGAVSPCVAGGVGTAACLAGLTERMISTPDHWLEPWLAAVADQDLSAHLLEDAGKQLPRFRFHQAPLHRLLTGLSKAMEGLPEPIRERWDRTIRQPLFTGRFFLCDPDDPPVASLAFADYACTETIAKRLGQSADMVSPAPLLQLAGDWPHPWGRRNAFRVMGRILAQENSPPASRFRSKHNQEIIDFMVRSLQRETGEDPLHDIIWILDSFFFPHYESQPHLLAIVDRKTSSESLRFRAFRAVGRLLLRSDRMLTPGDQGLLLASLKSDSSWIRAESAWILQRLPRQRYPAAIGEEFSQHLQTVYQNDPALPARFYAAGALDRWTGSSLAALLQQEYEFHHLPYTSTTPLGILRSALTARERTALLEQLKLQQQLFFRVLGDDFSAPVAGDPNNTVKLMVFPSRQIYTEYMETFVGYGSNSGGLYLEKTGTLYTYDRPASQSSYSLEELVRHEFGHYLQARYIYPGMWGSGDDFTQARGWADEGMSEILAEPGPGDPGPRTVHLRDLCAREHLPQLDHLLHLRAGYDKQGTFDYAAAWSFVYFLYDQYPDLLRDTYHRLRDRTYSPDLFSIFFAGGGESEWHEHLQALCMPAVADL